MRGDIYRLRAPRDQAGHEQDGPRYAVIVQTDAIMLNTVVVAPTSTRAAKRDNFRPEIDMDGTRTRVLVDQTGAVDIQHRLGDFAGRLSADEMARIDEALRYVMGVPR